MASPFSPKYYIFISIFFDANNFTPGVIRLLFFKLKQYFSKISVTICWVIITNDRFFEYTKYDPINKKIIGTIGAYK